MRFYLCQRLSDGKQFIFFSYTTMRDFIDSELTVGNRYCVTEEGEYFA